MVNDPNVEPDEREAISAKTVVIAGSRHMIRDSLIRLIARSISNSQLVFIERDHFIANKKPEEAKADSGFNPVQASKEQITGARQKALTGLAYWIPSIRKNCQPGI